MLRQNSDLISISFLALAAMLIALLAAQAGGALLVIQMILALPLVLILPGYAISAALFPQRSIGFADRLLLVAGLSIAATVITGIGLYLTHWGLTRLPWGLTLSAIVLVFSLAAGWRRRRDVTGSSQPLKLGLKPVQILQILLAVVTAGAAVRIASIEQPPAGILGYSSLWMVPASNSSLTPLKIGVSSQEFTPQSYNLQLSVDAQVVKEWQGINLNPGAKWETQADLTGDLSQVKVIEARLYRVDEPNIIYRWVVWRPVLPRE
jgi:hypothetical protein